ncbi:hypothetical protein Lal_00017473 [Lupinus albus]|nr:hypothetical protein Lal_00017473 [Lupinus albus]
MDSKAQYNPRTVEEVFRDFKGRRAGLIKALTIEEQALGWFSLLETENVESTIMVMKVLKASHTDELFLLDLAVADVEEFYSQCDPELVKYQMLDTSKTSLGSKFFSENKDIITLVVQLFFILSEKENLCLYGFPSEQWEVNLPAEEVPPELPEPVLGINFARDGMQEKDWLSLVAVHSDAWLLAIAFYFGARFGFDKADRKRLFNMINELSTIYEVVTGAAKKQVKEKSSVSNHSGSKSKSSSKTVNNVFILIPTPTNKYIYAILVSVLQCKNQRAPESQARQTKALPLPLNDEDEDDDDDDLDDEDEEEHEETLCGACGENYGTDEFWICCDICEKWFHGKCVKITPARADHIKQYKCPSCSNKRARP